MSADTVGGDITYAGAIFLESATSATGHFEQIFGKIDRIAGRSHEGSFRVTGLDTEAMSYFELTEPMYWGESKQQNYENARSIARLFLAEVDEIKLGAGGDTTSIDAFTTNARAALRGGDGDDTLGGSGKGNRLFGEAGDDRVSGLSGDDQLSGGTGRDELFGGRGNDKLVGGYGTDALRGGAGSDTFAFATGSGADTIVDFENGHDRIAIHEGARRFADLEVSRTADGTIVEFANVSILLEDVSKSSITAADFIF